MAVNLSPKKAVGGIKNKIKRWVTYILFLFYVAAVGITFHENGYKWDAECFGQSIRNFARVLTESSGLADFTSAKLQATTSHLKH